MLVLWVDAGVVLGGLGHEESGRELECAKEKVSQCKRMLEERREHRKVSWGPGGWSHPVVSPAASTLSSLTFSLPGIFFFTEVHEAARNSDLKGR